VVDHCVAAFNTYQQEREFRTYLTDALKAIAENTSRYILPGLVEVNAGTVMAFRWAAPTQPEKPAEEKPEDERSCEEIVNGIWSRMRGEQ
jgi:hypothetical protein